MKNSLAPVTWMIVAIAVILPAHSIQAASAAQIALDKSKDRQSRIRRSWRRGR